MVPYWGFFWILYAAKLSMFCQKMKRVFLWWTKTMNSWTEDTDATVRKIVYLHGKSARLKIVHSANPLIQSNSLIHSFTRTIWSTLSQHALLCLCSSFLLPFVPTKAHAAARRIPPCCCHAARESAANWWLRNVDPIFQVLLVALFLMPSVFAPFDLLFPECQKPHDAL